MRIVEGPRGRVYRVSRAYLGEIIREAIIAEKVRREEEPEPDVETSSDGSPTPPPRKDAAAPRNLPRQPPPPGQGQEEVPDVEDPADDEIAADAGEPDDDGQGPRSGKLADQLVGKTVQSVTMEPRSKLIPGSQEVVLTFNEITDPLKIIVAKNGKVSFFFRGSLHNLI